MRLSGPRWLGPSSRGNCLGRPSRLRRPGAPPAPRLAPHAGARWSSAQPGELFDVVDAELFSDDDQDLGSLPQSLPEAAQTAGRQSLPLVPPVELDQVEGDQPQRNRQLGGFFAFEPQGPLQPIGFFEFPVAAVLQPPPLAVAPKDAPPVLVQQRARKRPDLGFWGAFRPDEHHLEFVAVTVPGYRSDGGNPEGTGTLRPTSGEGAGASLPEARIRP